MNIVLNLPKPLSVNNLFVNSNNGRYPAPTYKAWRKEADQLMLTQGPLRCICGPVVLHITVSDSGKLDLDNTAKCLIDHLVHHGVIESDSRSIVRKITLEWGDVSGARIEITPATDWVTRKNLAQRTPEPMSQRWGK